MNDPTPVFHVDGSRYGHVRCPTCTSVFPIKQHQSKGASYAKETMTKLKDEQYNLLTWWLSHQWWNQQLTKSKLVSLFRSAGGDIGDPDSRISELLGLELIDVIKNGNEVSYTLNVYRSSKVLSNGGKL